MALKSETNKDSQVSSSKVLNPTCNIVIAPLNWGLGHATRSIPVIQFLLKNNINPIIASDGVSLELLRKEFPDLECVELTSYGVRYCKNGIFLRFKLLFQFPFLLYSAFREHRLLKGLVAHRKIDGVISDNRFGMFHKSIPSIYITHQIKVLSGATTFFSSWVHRMCIRNFDECWVPDSEGEQSLAGVLSSNCNLNMPLKYLGNLTRFSFTTSAYTYKYLLLLSGPEPQRTLLEGIFLKEFSTCSDPVLLVRGSKQKMKFPHKNACIHIVDMMHSKQLEKAISSAEFVICRSGYSSIMDLAALKKKVFFIPTPGQYEQLYLAQYLEQKGISGYCSQGDFSYKKLTTYFKYSGFSETYPKMLTKDLLGFLTVTD